MFRLACILRCLCLWLPLYSAPSGWKSTPFLRYTHRNPDSEVGSHFRLSENDPALLSFLKMIFLYLSGYIILFDSYFRSVYWRYHSTASWFYYSLEISHSNLLSLWKSSAFISLSLVFRKLHSDLSHCGFLLIYLGLKFIQQLYLKCYKHCLVFPCGVVKSLTFHFLYVCVCPPVTSSFLLWGFLMLEISSKLAFSSLIFSLAMFNLIQIIMDLSLGVWVCFLTFLVHNFSLWYVTHKVSLACQNHVNPHGRQLENWSLHLVPMLEGSVSPGSHCLASFPAF